MPSENRETLSPGDLCVIVAHEPMDPWSRSYVGRTVVLIDICWHVFSHLAPYWRCSGLPPTTMVSYLVLRRIPPDQMLDARSHMEPIDEINDEEVKV